MTHMWKAEKTYEKATLVSRARPGCPNPVQMSPSQTVTVKHVCVKCGDVVEGDAEIPMGGCTGKKTAVKPPKAAAVPA